MHCRRKGSVRIPAALNGLYGLRPTMRRLPYAGAANTLLGMETIESSIGPLSSSLSGVKVSLLMHARGHTGTH